MSNDEKKNAKVDEAGKPWSEPELKTAMTDEEAEDAVGGARRNWPPGTGPRAPGRSHDPTGRIRPYLRRTGQL